MSNSIWKTPDQKPDGADTRKQILFYAGGSMSFLYLGWHYPDKGFGSWNYDDVQQWAYLEDVLAQADKAERLEEENEAMREEFEVWHGNHKCVLEDNERLQKTLEALKDFITKLYLSDHITDKHLENYKNILKNL